MNRENEQKYDLTELIAVGGTNANQVAAVSAAGETVPYRLTAGGMVVNVRFRPDGSLTSCLARALSASL